jgi:hypothetical protein
MKTLLQTVAAAFATIPGLAAIIKGVGVPTDWNLEVIFGALATLCGSLILLLLYSNRDNLKKLSQRNAARFAVLSLSLGIVALVAYLVLFNFSVVRSGPRNPVFVPLWNSADVNRKIAKHGGRTGALSFFGSAGLETLVDNEPYAAVRLGVTAAVLLVPYLGFVAFFTVAFGLPSFRLRNDF